MVDGDFTEGLILPEDPEALEEQKKRVSNFAKTFSDPENQENPEKRLDDSYVHGKVTFSEVSRKQYEKTYGLVGNHSGVQVCSWNKKAVKGEAVCYKQKFYGIECHSCAQMSPALAWCTEACVFCWRPSEWMKKTTFGEQEVDDPEFIVQETVRVRKKLISGIGGAAHVTPQRFKEAFQKFPSHWAISLSGEPTIYPKLGAMIKNLKARKEVKSIFVVTNGQEPQHLERLAGEDALPTQLYVSLTAPNAAMFKHINRSIYPDGWERLNRTLELWPSLRCRRVVRMTVIKQVNDQTEHLETFAGLLEKSKTDFIEIKSYMALGFSRRRLDVKNMLSHDEIKAYAQKLQACLPNYRWEAEDESSRIVLLKRKDSSYGNIAIAIHKCNLADGDRRPPFSVDGSIRKGDYGMEHTLQKSAELETGEGGGSGTEGNGNGCAGF